MEKSENKSYSDSSQEMSYKFGKEFKLHHRTLVNNLFLSGKSLYAYPLKMIWQQYSQQELDSMFCGHTPANIGPVQIMITVPKKRQKKAVNRVWLRRRIRESFRLNHSEIDEAISKIPNHGTLSIGFIYISNEKEPYAKIQKKMCQLLKTVVAKIENKPTEQEGE
jgi:ribonuclease P protein component